GWANVTDPGTKARLVQKFKSENPKNIPKPSISPKGAANTAANLNAPNAAPGAPVPAGGSPFQGKGKGKGEKFQAQAEQSAAPGKSPGSGLAPVGQGQGKKNKAEKFESQSGVAPGNSPPEGAASFENKGKKNAQRFDPYKNFKFRESAGDVRGQ